jgi:1-acyl-sn-glycerol-3-phosphate acyltransferase
MEKEKKKTKKPQKWMRPRHRVIQNIAYYVLYPYCKWKYAMKIDKFKEQEDRPYLILMNHQTPFDQFFVGMAFKRPLYYMATEDIFSLGWISKVLRWVVAPIPIKKQTVDLNAIMTCMRLAREGGSIVIAPEGNRTYSGKTEYMNPSIAGMAKKLKMPIVLYRIEGGYGSQPRWSDGIRKGKMHCYVQDVIQPEEYEKLSNEELFSRIEKGLYVDEAVAEGCFRSKKKAEFLERVMYVCPWCGLSEFESHGNEAHCKKCGRKITYGEDKTIAGVDCEFPYRFVNDWYEYQKDYVNQIDPAAFENDPAYTDTADFSEVIVYKRKEPIRKGASLKLYGDRVVVDESTAQEQVLDFDTIHAMSVLGHNKLNIYYEKHVYQFKGDKRFNAVKYVNFYHHYKNLKKGEGETFLGL